MVDLANSLTLPRINILSTSLGFKSNLENDTKEKISLDNLDKSLINMFDYNIKEKVYKIL